MKDKIFGARASVYLKYDGDIESLLAILSRVLIVPNCCVETKELPPHDLFGTFETLGFEGWLETSECFDGYAYCVEMSTEHSVEESMQVGKHDLSLWFARHIESVSELDTFVPRQSDAGDGY